MERFPRRLQEQKLPDDVHRRGRRRELLYGVLAVAFLAAAIVSLFLTCAWSEPLPVPSSLKYCHRRKLNSISASEAGGLPMLSPDGTAVAFSATDANGKSMLWIRSFDSLAARPLAGTEGGALPFWSPDSRRLGFFADGKLKTLELSGGPARVVADAPNYGWRKLEPRGDPPVCARFNQRPVPGRGLRRRPGPRP